MFEYRHTYNNINRDRSRGERGSCTPTFKSARVEKGGGDGGDKRLKLNDKQKIVFWLL
jgi:hypothetical protein